jgi:hypothetical protein
MAANDLCDAHGLTLDWIYRGDKTGDCDTAWRKQSRRLRARLERLWRIHAALDGHFAVRRLGITLRQEEGIDMITVFIWTAIFVLILLTRFGIPSIGIWRRRRKP